MSYYTRNVLEVLLNVKDTLLVLVVFPLTYTFNVNEEFIRMKGIHKIKIKKTNIKKNFHYVLKQMFSFLYVFVFIKNK